MRGSLVAIVGLFVLTGCAGMQYAMETYSGIDPVLFTPPGQEKTFRVFDKPSMNRVMLTSTLGDAARIGAVEGFTLTMVDADAPEKEYARAAQAFLDSGKRGCTVVSSEKLLKVQYEMRYVCR